MKRKLTGVIVVLAGLLAVSLFLSQDRQEVGNSPGMIAENFQLPMYEQPEGELHDYFGDVIVLNTWASWCEPCREEMPALMQLQNDYHGQGLSVLTVNMQKTERTLQDAAEFIEEMNITLPVFFDEDGFVYDQYQLPGLPVTYIINRDGVIEERIPGEVTYEGLEELILPLLDQ